MMSCIPDVHRAHRGLAAFEPARHPTVASLRQSAIERQFVAIESAYAHHGGLATGDAVAEMLRTRSSQTISALARWIVDRRIVSFNWQSRLLIPLFQFDPVTMRPRPCVIDAVAELSPFLDDWALASWFVESNAWLDDCSPLDVIDDDPHQVIQAARADRHVVRW